ncbi:hypothetical protein AN189_02955 [Loktanella sp. 3ANDIMAR09]|uniref:helix-turn-helix domain-containing protein n=1 Tax=Loktanella sp. 3ANDIMAR09 TaxID=1225657 RepID=UPI0006FB6F54|nr:helix-turn-helix domain-containing protein [Loktanella sp. 3ANDIMAR09]KQI69396.1 hypothetical protein AN189_02955 [Loktanella sp. 3ANDIMAR09]
MNIGHNSRNIPLDALTGSMQDVAETLGMGMVFALVEHFAGVELKVPHKLRDGHKLMALGREQAEMLCDFYGDNTIHVPTTLDPGQVRRRVLELEARGLKRWEIAREVNISQRHVRRLANSAQHDDRQDDLFGDLD